MQYFNPSQIPSDIFPSGSKLCPLWNSLSQADFGAPLKQFEWLNSYQLVAIGAFLVIPVTKTGGLCMHVTLPPMQMEYLEKVFNNFLEFSAPAGAA